MKNEHGKKFTFAMVKCMFVDILQRFLNFDTFLTHVDMVTNKNTKFHHAGMC